MTSNIPLINISVQPVELCKLLKIANMVSGGGEAKIVISEGYVLVNNEVEFQKRKKVYQNDVIEFNGEIVQVNVTKASLKSPEAAKIKEQNKAFNKASKAKVKTNKPLHSTDKDSRNEIENQAPSRSKRKPISF